MSFTGIRDLDIKIMNDLPDEDLLRFCQTNVRISNICRDDDFWRRRLTKKFGNVQLNNFGSWKELYIYYIIREKYGNFLGDINTIRDEKPRLVTVEEYYVWLNRYFKLSRFVNNKHLVGSSTKLEERIKGYPGLDLILYLTYYDDYGWNSELIDVLKQNGRYFEIPSKNLIRPSDRKGLKNYIFIPELRVSGSPDDIRKYLLSLGLGLRGVNAGIENGTVDPPDNKSVIHEVLPEISDLEEKMKHYTLVGDKANETFKLIKEIIKKTSEEFEETEKRQFIAIIRNKLAGYM